MLPAVAKREIVVLDGRGVVAPHVGIGLVQVRAPIQLESEMEAVEDAVATHQNAASDDPVLTAHAWEHVTPNDITIEAPLQR